MPVQAVRRADLQTREPRSSNGWDPMTETEEGQERPPGRGPGAGIVTLLTIVVAMAGITAVLVVLSLQPTAGQHDGLLTAVLVAAAFAAAEVFVVHLHVRRNSHSFSMTEFPLMNGFAVRYSEAGLVIIAVDIREEEGDVAAFAQSLNATFPLGLDIDGSAQRAWGAFALPTHFWIDRDGVVRDGAIGEIGPDIMARGVGKILPGVEVTP